MHYFASLLVRYENAVASHSLEFAAQNAMLIRNTDDVGLMTLMSSKKVLVTELMIVILVAVMRSMIMMIAVMM